ncbi:hypothetical protein ASPWEDRAFT_174012 [Aspergillus wentii DTO 134E9]|uniref:Uncharacterized protein n=1 Tax=Aspergillus wentii DTO 134E9 TaxID=1073089 RepID=A0A1L9RI49_ASPWE|nr:uncharacterized protein ASPWEDRAFT_174012 [Aspergillus wentii DTO 134E9]OJJ34606.1 hypothetical protein ASPWEDRAFT_174012 [Aspergillus wentii DTO 134E9]
MAIWLIDKGADVTSRAKDSTCSTLDMAARRCSAAVVQRIVDAAKDQLKTDQPLANDMLLWTKEKHVLDPSPDFGFGRTALMEAAMEGKENIVNILLDHGANPVSLCLGISALTAARRLRWKTLERILHAYTDTGGDINSDKAVIPPGCRRSSRYDHPALLPLQHFARKGCVQGVKMLLEHNADPALIGGDREMIPLHHVLLLKRYKTRHDERSPSEHRVPAKRGATALHLAVSRRRAKVVAMLLDNGADVLATNDAGKILLGVAITRRHPAILDMMKKATPVES